ncbi:N-acetylmuramoyl-L-alanine amidase [Streptomyces sp. ISL-10]|uniref:peptidoglycan recognition protein family protein n=1 Tax=Streptomyces sp. ISL-10 TaxID=2819172 RepID=UPI001BED328B|nr:N-acetylmuramoyl-L-alanine amidase [Streptomyces sp. ISL-10]MBT2368653.1 N-acetylmuramoyl-L-alanine amidase [Streptomyces sp. ISL-10]
MRGYLASSITVAGAAALVLPLSLTPGALASPWDRTPDVPGSTRSLPLRPLGEVPSVRGLQASVQGLPAQDVEPFSLVGIVWEDEAAELDGTVEVRTRGIGSGTWSAWQEVETHNEEHAADPGTAESESGRVRGATAPLWVGASDGVEVRVRQADGSRADRLPEGMRLELVDPGDDPADIGTSGPGNEGSGNEGNEGNEGSVGRAPAGGLGIPALNRLDTEAEAAAAGDLVLDPVTAKPYIGPRPGIVTRRGWGADESLREEGFVYTDSVRAAFVHHTDTGNNYTCSQAPAVIRSIYRYHVESSGWRDIGYNFVVDKCGDIYEGRAGGVAEPVKGAHTLGFNTNSTGIAVLGTYSSSNPPAAAVTAVAKLTAWKLGLHGVNPKGKVTLTSAGSGKYAGGTRVRLNAISGHRDGFDTDCPGSRLYGKLGTARSASAKYQGR